MCKKQGTDGEIGEIAAGHGSVEAEAGMLRQRGRAYTHAASHKAAVGALDGWEDECGCRGCLAQRGWVRVESRFCYLRGACVSTAKRGVKGQGAVEWEERGAIQ